MRITPDTNVLLRAALNDDKRQGELARAALASAVSIAIPSATFCEFVWVLRSGYRKPGDEVARSISDLISDEKVNTNRAAVEAGLSMLLAGGDFADGLIAYEGAQMGGDSFVTFDRKAAGLISAADRNVELLPSA